MLCYNLFAWIAEGYEETAAEHKHHRGAQAHKVEKRRTQHEKHQHVRHCWH
jgi:hypothetical protein